MKKMLLALVAGLLVVGCESAPKKEEAKAAPVAPAKDAKAKSGKKQKGFEDEDISKAKPAAASAEVSQGKTTCKNGGDERILEMTSGDGKVCRLVYTKGGESKEVASGTSEATKCNEIHDRIKGNLEGAGFKCE